jgi:uncharacterized protein YbjT (DUF2867 family)
MFNFSIPVLVEISLYGRRQKAEGRRQKAEGRGQEAEGKRLLPGCFSRSICPNSPDYSNIFYPSSFILHPSSFILQIVMSSTILVTGATGTVGQAVVQQLQQQQIGCRVAVRQPERVPAWFGDRIEAVRFDFLDPSTFAAAFSGITRLFLVRPPALSQIQQIAPALDAAKAAGVKQIVFLSLLGVERIRVVPHAAIERYIQQLDMPYTFLRAGFFMQNLSTTHRDDIRLHHDLFVPAGNGKTSFIDARDIAAVAAVALTQPGHTPKIYTLTGNESFTYFQVAEMLTKALDRPIRYSHPSLFKFIRVMQTRGLPLDFILVMAGIYTTTRFGWADRITPDVERLLGRSPISLQQFIHDHQSVWQS